MFTGIVEALGTIEGIKKSSEVWDVCVTTDAGFLSGVKRGDSIALNGVCLTVISFGSDRFVVQAIAETRKSVSCGMFEKGACVNLEKALVSSGRLDGHIVQGHVDGVGTIRTVVRESNAYLFSLNLPKELAVQIVKKGSIAIDGISLTIQDCDDTGFSVAVIPHTYAVTSLSRKKAGDEVNLETDILGKYVLSYVRKMTVANHSSSVTLSQLQQHGF